MDTGARRTTREVLSFLESEKISLSDLTVAILMHPPNNNHPQPFLLNDLTRNCRVIFDSFYAHSWCKEHAISWGHKTMSKYYAESVKTLAQNEEHWHFNTVHATPVQVEDFRLEDMAKTVREEYPRLWSLVFRLATGFDVVDGVTDEVARRGLDGEENDEEKHCDTPTAADLDLRRRQILDLRVVKTVTVISIFAQARFQKCNLLQAVTGLFLHSCGAPEKIIKVLARMGVSVSLSSIHRAIHSLSRESSQGLQRLGRSLLVSYAYDNFDVKFNVGVPTADGPSSSLVHLTSGLMLKLGHGVTLDHLRVAGSLWDMNPKNPLATNKKTFDPHRAFELLYTLHPPLPGMPNVQSSRLSRRGQFRAWFFLQTLMTYGPTYFAGMKAAVGDPTAVELIPVCKTEFLPFRAMDINQSKVSGNIDAISNMLGQSGVGSRGADESGLDEVDISPYVQLVHGDLGTMERILSAIHRRAIEMTPEDRLQFVIPVFGLFHFKMAAADAIWRIEVSPILARKDPTSFMAFLERLRPKSANKLINNAGFREQHDLISHVGSILRLDVWRIEAKRLGYQSLQEWADASPPFKDVIGMAERIVAQYVEGGQQASIFEKQTHPAEQRDKQHENTMRTHAYLLYYEELSYAMNSGDIGRIETLFLPWIQIFKATGKHKYANHTLLFVHLLYEVYSPELRHAVRYNMLVNPTGKPNHFRAVDWMVELLNLYTKEIYGGGSSNYTKKRILEESPLVFTYRKSHANFERNFHLNGLSVAHTPKSMAVTFEELLLYIKSLKASPNEHLDGRTAHYSIPDVLTRGAGIIEIEAKQREMKLESRGGMGEEPISSGNMGEEGEENSTEDVSADDLAVDGPL